MPRDRNEPLATPTDRQPSGSTRRIQTTQAPVGKVDMDLIRAVLHQPTEQTTTKTGDISSSSLEALQVLDELRTGGARITRDIRALDGRPQPHHVMQGLEERGWVRRLGREARDGKQHTVWALTAGGLRHLES